MTGTDTPGPKDQADDALVRELARVARQMDAVPPEVLAAARGSLAWRTIDAELAALASDSLLDDTRLADVRSGAEPRLLSFESEDLTVEVQVTEGGGALRLVGQLVPPGPGEIALAHSRGHTDVEADDRGRFSAGDVGPGPVRLQVRRPGGPAVQTEWVVM